MNPFLSQGGGSSFTDSNSARAGDIGPTTFGNFGGLSFGAVAPSNASTWVIGGALVLLAFVMLRRKG